jgi:hypothetical protein
MPNVGLDALMYDMINVIQQRTLSAAGLIDVGFVAQRLELAPALWLNATQQNQPVCQAKLRSQLNIDAGTLIKYQFGNKGADAHIDWISFWHCSGATFGCTGYSLDSCPLANSCFALLYQTFTPVISFPGGLISLGNNTTGSLGLFTPQYSPSFVANELKKIFSLLHNGKRR